MSKECKITHCIVRVHVHITCHCHSGGSLGCCLTRRRRGEGANGGISLTVDSKKVCVGHDEDSFTGERGK